MRALTSAVALAAAALPFALAQTSTDCDPTKKTCPKDVGLNSASYSADFAAQGSSANASWSTAAYTTITYASDGAEFSIANKNQAPTLQTDFYIFFGRVDVKMKAAPGQGIVSSLVLLSDDLDEIDFEWLGGDSTQVQSNFYGKGNTTVYDRGGTHTVSNPQTEFHTYSFDWNSDRIEYIIDGNTVRTVSYNDPTTVGGTNYPQTPMRLKLGSWCGGCDGEPAGTVQWAGGKTTFGNDPYVMVVDSVTISNNNPAESYTYGDKSGSWESIQINKDGSSGSASSTASVTATASGSSGSSGSNASTATVAPTSSLSVAGIEQNSGAIATGTVTGSAGSMTTGSASGYSNGTMATSVSATTEVPGSSPSGSSGSSGSGSGSSSNGTVTSGGDASSSSGAAQQTGSSGASTNSIVTVCSLLSIALGFLML